MPLRARPIGLSTETGRGALAATGPNPPGPLRMAQQHRTLAGERGNGVIVVGSANQDYILRVRKPPKAGETVLAESLLRQAGGKGANQAVAAARLGADVQFIGCVGDDADGALLMQQLRSHGVDIANVDIVDEPTGVAVVAVYDSGENAITVVPGANFSLSAARVSDTVQAVCARATVLVVQAELLPEIIQVALRSAEAAGLRPILNLAPYQAMPAELIQLCDPLVVNESEARALVGRTVNDASSAGLAVEELRRVARSIVVTMGARGAYWADQNSTGHVPAPPVERVIDTTGAGDAFVGALAAFLANGSSIEEAVRAGVKAGTFAVTGLGAQSYPTLSNRLHP